MVLSVSIRGAMPVLPKTIVMTIDDRARAGMGTRASSMWMLGRTKGMNGFGMSKPIGITTCGRRSPAASASSEVFGQPCCSDASSNAA